MERKKKMMNIKSRSSRLQVALIMFPGLVVFVFFTVYPIAKLFIMSFFQWDFGSMLRQKFIGFENYTTVFSDRIFRTSFVNTLVYTIVTVPGQMALGLFVALLLMNIQRLKITFRVANYIPVITSWVIASLIFRYLFNTEGILNYFFTSILYVTNHNIRWLDSRWSGLWVAMLLGIWKGVGWNMVVFLAALQQVPKDLYEAASLDGCNGVQRFFHVTIPCIRGTILFALIMLTIGGFNVFTSIKMITNGNPAHQTDTLLTWMYHKAFSTGKFGYSSALSFVMAGTLAILAILQFKVMRSHDAKAGLS